MRLPHLDATVHVTLVNNELSLEIAAWHDCLFLGGIMDKTFIAAEQCPGCQQTAPWGRPASADGTSWINDHCRRRLLAGEEPLISAISRFAMHTGTPLLMFSCSRVRLCTPAPPFEDR